MMASLIALKQLSQSIRGTYCYFLSISLKVRRYHGIPVSYTHLNLESYLKILRADDFGREFGNDLESFKGFIEKAVSYTHLAHRPTREESIVLDELLHDGAF